MNLVGISSFLLNEQWGAAAHWEGKMMDWTIQSPNPTWSVIYWFHKSVIWEELETAEPKVVMQKIVLVNVDK